MDRLSQLKADKAPVLVTTTPEEQILEHQSNMETLWRKVSDNLFNVKEVISKLNQLKKDLSEKLFTRRLGANVLTVGNNTVVMSEDEIIFNRDVDIAGKMLFTVDGGIAHKYINGTGAVSVKGTVVHITGNNTVDGIIINVPDPIGVVYEDGIANGQEMWVVTEGKAECLVIGTCTAGQLARGFVTGEASYVKGSLICENFTVAPFATDKHFYEFGHVNTGRTGAGLAMIQIHKN